jgi:hypothetical protein
VFNEDELKDLIHLHLREMRKCNSKEEAITWMAGAASLLDRTLSLLDRPKLFVIPGSFGEKTYTLADPSESVILPAPGFYKPRPVWFDGKTVIYGDKYQNRAWTAKDTRKLEQENMRKRNASKTS